MKKNHQIQDYRLGSLQLSEMKFHFVSPNELKSKTNTHAFRRPNTKKSSDNGMSKNKNRSPKGNMWSAIPVALL